VTDFSQQRSNQTFQDTAMPFSDRFDDALTYASRLHREQTRKGSDIPYVAHLLAVCSLVIEHGGSEDQAIAALLHDAAEDQGGEPRLSEIRARYGAAVADIVADCTDAWTEPKPPWRPRKEAYLAALPSKPSTSLLVSLADKVHNASAILGDYQVLGDELWDRFKGGREGTIWYYRSVSEVFDEVMPGALAEQLSRTVLQFAGNV
jgi:(p)ppGpp synthase/HD superfamily hydrolase